MRIEDAEHVLLVGPSLYPVTGQSLAFHKVVEHIKSAIVVRNSPRAHENGLFFYTLYWCRLISIFMFNKVEVCYFTSSRTLFGFLVRDAPLVLLFSFRGVKIVNHLHGADFRLFRDSFPCLGSFIDYVYNKISTSIVLYENMCVEYERYRTMHISVVNNFFERKELSRGQVEAYLQEQGGSKGRFNLLFLSNLIAEKGISELVDAVVDCDLAGRNVHLKIAGAFLEENSDLRRKISEASSIEYLGVVHGVTKERLLLDADVVCLPSYYRTEAQPICLIEAMAYGCAIITTQHNYLPLLVSDDCGLKVEPRSVSRLIDAICHLYDDHDLLCGMKRHCFELAESKYTLDSYLAGVVSALRT